MIAAVEPTLSLSIEDRRRFDHLDEVVTAGLKTFLAVAEALAEIKAAKLYRENFGNFEEYCKQRHGLSRTRAYQLLDARDVMGELQTSTIVDILPTNECQLRALVKVPEGKAPEAWQAVVEHSKEVGKPITGEMVGKVVRDISPSSKETKAKTANGSATLATSVITDNNIFDRPNWDRLFGLCLEHDDLQEFLELAALV